MKMITKRQLVYKFLELPYVIQRQIAHEMKLVPATLILKDEDFQKEFFLKLNETNQVEVLKHRLFRDYAPDPEQTLHPCD